MRPIITLTTDFGPESPYVAQMKGVILSVFHDAELVDISHAITPQNIREGAVVLADVTPRFPDGLTILDARGQWRDSGRKQIMREPSKLVEISKSGQRSSDVPGPAAA